MTKVPILLLTFNRPDTTQRVFEAIKRIQPTKLFIAQDGPRNDKERAKTDAVKKLRHIDRPCEVRYLTRETNLGCLVAVSSAIDWFFTQVDFGIILEDDCIPSEQVCIFAEAVDRAYRNDERVGCVSLSNYMTNHSDKVSIFTEHNPLLRGWATRKRARDKYRTHTSVIPSLEPATIKGTWLTKKAISRYMNGGYRDSNRYAVCYRHARLTIVPPVNLTTNIGYIGIHNQRPGKYHDIPLGTLDIPFAIDTGEITLSTVYNKEMESFLRRMYIYTQIEKLLKKIRIYNIVHKTFLYIVMTLHKKGKN